MKLFRRHVRQDPAQVSVPDRIGKPGGKKFQREVLVTDRGEKLSDLCSPACNPCPKKGIVKSQKCTGFLVISNKKIRGWELWKLRAQKKKRSGMRKAPAFFPGNHGAAIQYSLGQCRKTRKFRVLEEYCLVSSQDQQFHFLSGPDLRSQRRRDRMFP